MFAKNAIFVFLLSLDVFSINIFSETCNIADDPDLAKIMFMFGPEMEDYVEYNLKDAAVLLLKHPKFIHKQTHMFMPGYRHHKLYSGTVMMATAHFKRNTTNFLNLEWEKLANGDYTSAQQNVLQLSPRIADFIIKLFMLGLPQDSLSLSGQSMGARGIAVFARDVIKRSNGTMILARITPLDPSNEEAHDVFILPHIKKSWAKFVDIIHTDAGGIATRQSMGHADFWPNNGTAIQPGCPSDFEICSHKKSGIYWAESVANGKSNPVLAYASGSFDELLKNGNEHYKNSAVVMGADCSTSARGDYYLQHQTNYADYYCKPL